MNGLDYSCLFCSSCTIFQIENCDVTNHLSSLKKLLADGGYTGENFANEIKRISGAEVEVVKRNELHTFAVLPKRWIVERSFAWFDKYRRLWKNCERKLQLFSNDFSRFYSFTP